MQRPCNAIFYLAIEIVINYIKKRSIFNIILALIFPKQEFVQISPYIDALNITGSIISFNICVLEKEFTNNST